MHCQHGHCSLFNGMRSASPQRGGCSPMVLEQSSVCCRLDLNRSFSAAASEIAFCAPAVSRYSLEERYFSRRRGFLGMFALCQFVRLLNRTRPTPRTPHMPPRMQSVRESPVIVSRDTSACTYCEDMYCEDMYLCGHASDFRYVTGDRRRIDASRALLSRIFTSRRSIRVRLVSVILLSLDVRYLTQFAVRSSGKTLIRGELET